MTKHTPGPWEPVWMNNFRYLIKPVSDDVVEPVGESTNWGDASTAEANAHFIAAAPDMEDALKIIAGSSHGASCEGFGASKRLFSCSCHVLIAKKALDKAGGR